MRKNKTRKYDMKKVLIGIGALVAFFALYMVIMMNLPKEKLSDQYDEERVIAEGEQVVELFQAQDYQAIIDMAADSMKETVTVEDFIEQCEEPSKEWGDFVEYTKYETVGVDNEETGETYGGVIITAKYENTKVQFGVCFNEDMEIVEFSIK